MPNVGNSNQKEFARICDEQPTTICGPSAVFIARVQGLLTITAEPTTLDDVKGDNRCTQISILP
jgi:hypothetical protein